MTADDPDERKVVSLDERRAARQFRIAQAKARHPSTRPARQFRKPKTET